MSNTVCCFHFSIVNQGKNISEAPKELEDQPCRKFESYMMEKTGGLVSTEKPCTFLTPRHAKNPGISWVFWGGIFFVPPFWWTM